MLFNIGDILINTNPLLDNNKLIITEINNRIITFWDIWKNKKINLDTQIMNDLRSYGDYDFVHNDLWVRKNIKEDKLSFKVWEKKVYDFLDPTERFKRMPIRIGYNLKKLKF
jgi:hypothetical protein